MNDVISVFSMNGYNLALGLNSLEIPNTVFALINGTYWISTTFVPNVEVLEPKELRKAEKENLIKTLRNYGK